MSMPVKIVLALALLGTASSAPAWIAPPHPSHWIRDLVVLPGGDMLMLHSDGVYRRGRQERSWKLVVRVREIERMREHGGVLYLETHSGLHVSTDGGIGWAPRKHHWIDTIGADGTLYGCGEGGPETSKDQGRSWQALAEPSEAPREHPLRCGGWEHEARDGDQQYVLDREGKLYRRNGPRDSWIRLALRESVPAGAIPTGLHVDRRGVVYINAFVAKRDANKSWPHMVYRSRDHGVHWEALDWGSAPVKPIDPEVRGVWNQTLLMTCRKPGSYGKHLCVADDGDPNAVHVKAQSPSTSIGDYLRVAPDGSIYDINMYDIQLLAPGAPAWKPLGLEGVPGPFGESRR